MSDNERKCDICNCTIFDDGTVDDCGGDCGREICRDTGYAPLSFDDDGVLRELPDPEPMWPEDRMDDIGGNGNEGLHYEEVEDE